MLVTLYIEGQKRPIKTIEIDGRKGEFHRAWINNQGTLCAAKFAHKRGADSAVAHKKDVVKAKLFKASRKPRTVKNREEITSNMVETPSTKNVLYLDTQHALDLAAKKRTLTADV